VSRRPDFDGLVRLERNDGVATITLDRQGAAIHEPHSIATQKRMVDASAEPGLASGLQLIEMFPPRSAPDMAERPATFKKS